MSDFREKLCFEFLKSLIDKVILGAVVGLAAYYASVLLEEYKIKTAAQIDINKKKIDKLSEVWEKAYLLDSKIPVYKDLYKKTYVDSNKRFMKKLNSMVEEIDNGANAKKLEKDFYIYEKNLKKELISQIESIRELQLKEFDISLNKNEFWIDIDKLSVLKEYSKTVTEITRLSPFKNDNYKEEVKELLGKLDKLSIKIEDVRSEMIEGG